MALPCIVAVVTVSMFPEFDLNASPPPVVHAYIHYCYDDAVTAVDPTLV